MMNWDKAQELILNNVSIGTDVNTGDSTHRTVLDNPPYLCRSYDYNGIQGYKVKIGSGNSANVEIPVLMLKTLFEASKRNGNIYNREVFKKNFNKQLNHHGCHVHAVGMIFVKAGVSVKKGNNYQLTE